MSQTTYQIVLICLLVTGLVLSSAFLVQFRPTQWARLASWDAVGWIVIVWLLYARSLIVIGARWPNTTVPTGWLDLSASIGLLVLVDVLLALRIVSFVNFRIKDRAAQNEAQRRATLDQQAS